jgi:hypothetical protein
MKPSQYHEYILINIYLKKQKAARERCQVTSKSIPMRITADFLTEILNAMGGISSTERK